MTATKNYISWWHLKAGKPTILLSPLAKYVPLWKQTNCKSGGLLTYVQFTFRKAGRTKQPGEWKETNRSQMTKSEPGPGVSINGYFTCEWSDYTDQWTQVGRVADGLLLNSVQLKGNTSKSRTKLDWQQKTGSKSVVQIQSMQLAFLHSGKKQNKTKPLVPCLSRS